MYMSIEQHTVDDYTIAQVDELMYEVTNFSHSDPTEHRYIVTLGDNVSYCNCKAFKYQSGECKHIEAVREFQKG